MSLITSSLSMKVRYSYDNCTSVINHFLGLTTPNAWVAKRRDADIGAIAR